MKKFYTLKPYEIEKFKSYEKTHNGMDVDYLLKECMEYGEDSSNNVIYEEDEEGGISITTKF